MSGAAESIGKQAATVDRVFRMLRHQEDLFTRLEALSARQRDLLIDEDTTPLLTVLTQRKRVVGELSAVQESLAPVRRVWSRFLDGLPEDLRGEADRLVASSQLRLSRVLEQDERDTHVLSVRRKMTATSILATRASVEAISAYRSSATAVATAGRLDEAP